MKKYDDLLVFVTVVDRQSFIGAARQLGLPPGTVSRKVQELETRLGIMLLNRTTRRLSVTEVGREVYDAASRGFAAIEEAESLAIVHHDKPAGVRSASRGGYTPASRDSNLGFRLARSL